MKEECLGICEIMMTKENRMLIDHIRRPILSNVTKWPIKESISKSPRLVLVIGMLTSMQTNKAINPIIHHQELITHSYDHHHQEIVDIDVNTTMAKNSPPWN